MTSSLPSTDPSTATPDALALIAARLMGGGVRSIVQGGQGGNNRVYKVVGTDGAPYALKCYPPSINDSRDRLGAEFGGLRFLAERGETRVPAAVAADRAANMALYGWVDGDALGLITDRDVDQALGFADRLRHHARSDAACTLPLASEACLSAGELTTQVTRRLERLTAVAVERPDQPGLSALLAEGVAPAFDRWRSLAERDWGDNILPLARTLSPSDFGFHNALRLDDGDLTFVDFEYFGWDDPVRLVADFLLHPGMTLNDALKGRFLDGAMEIFAADPTFSPRFAMLYPLVGLRWCLIILNEFLPERWSGRAFAGTGHRAVAEERQLAKARSLLELLRRHDGRPPFVR